MINYLKVKNMHHTTGIKEIEELFRLIESEESPFTISQNGKKTLEALLTKNKEWKKYEDFVIKALSVRVL